MKTFKCAVDLVISDNWKFIFSITAWS